MNVVVLIGRLTKDPELRYTQSGKAVATLRLAVDRGTTNPQGERETDFINVIVWDRQAEAVANHLQKGRLVAVQGRLQIRQYETQDGQRRERADVVARTIRFLDRGHERSQKPGATGMMGSEITVEEDEEVPF